MNNRLIRIMLILLTVITLVGVVALVVILNLNDDPNAEPTIDEVLEASVDIEEITTNLYSNDYIKISFKIQTSSKNAKKELEKRNFQVKDIIIKELSEMKAEDLKGKEGKHHIEEMIRSKVNSIMQEGTVEKVYITSLIIQ
jgi:flagellar protein FliL